MPTNFDDHRPSERSPIAASRACSCHSSSGIRKDAARSATSSHELARALGVTLTLGGAGPSSRTARRDFVDAIARLLLRSQLRDLCEGCPVLSNQRGLLIHGRFLDPQEQVLAELLKVIQTSHRTPSELCVCKPP